MGECVQWSDLPEDLVEKVLSMLPLKTILNLRSTCRIWNSLVVSRNLLSLCTGDPCPTPCLLGTSPDCEMFVGYNPESRTWYNLFLAFPVPHLRRGVYLAASAGGLLCFIATIHNAAAFFVCNPTTRSWRQLRYPKVDLQPRVGLGHHSDLATCKLFDNDLATCMLFDKARQQYKIIVVGNAAIGWGRITQIYFSCTDSWMKVGDVIPRDVEFRSYGLVCNGCVYNMMAGWSFKVMLLNVEDGVWRTLEAPLPYFLVRPRLVERNDSLLLGGRVCKYSRQGLNFLKQSVRLWELDQINLVWVEIGRMPEDIHNKFVATLGEGLQDFKCSGLEHLLYFTSRCSSGSSVVVFNFLTNSWSWVPYPEKFAPVDNVVTFQSKLSSLV